MSSSPIRRRIKTLTTELDSLKRKRDELEEELRELRTKEEKARKDALSLVPRDLTAAATAWKDGKVTREEIEQLWRLLWGNDKSGDFFTYKGANVFDIITNDMLWDIEDCQAEIYFDLARVQFVGPFRYDSEEDQAEANIWRVRDTAFCAFAK